MSGQNHPHHPKRPVTPGRHRGIGGVRGVLAALGAFGALLAVVAAATVLAPVDPAAAQAAARKTSGTVDGPPLDTPPDRLAAALDCPSDFPRSQREPVLLVHGTGVDAALNWGWNYAPALRAQGYDVCTVDLPARSTGDIQESAEYVVHAVAALHAATGRKADVVAHSQGGLQVRWGLTWWPGMRAAVDDVVSLGTPEHGTAAGDLLCALPCAAAAHQMKRGSAFLTALNSGDQTPGDVSYTSIFTRDDLVVTPHRTAAKEGARNIGIQEVCGIRLVTHIGLVYDSVAFRLVLDALGRAGPADPKRLPAGACWGDPYVPGVDAGDVLHATTVVAPAAATALATAAKTRREPALRPYAATGS
ncbi:esterase/lipase family protein [Streptomyces sp. NPDC020412]|uniref:esterase/lipase family protein n=1 Tax=Streptomyces sp. NPDC020412 TaxID=3365073 RepID=UPI0037AC24C4